MGAYFFHKFYKFHLGLHRSHGILQKFNCCCCIVVSVCCVLYHCKNGEVANRISYFVALLCLNFCEIIIIIIITLLLLLLLLLSSSLSSSSPLFPLVLHSHYFNTQTFNWTEFNYCQMRKSRVLLLESRSINSGINIFEQTKNNDEGTDISCHYNFTLVEQAMVCTHVWESLRE